MTTIAITKNAEGKICGAGEKAQKAYAHFRKMIEALEPGEVATVAFWFPRNPALMGWHMVLLGAVHDAQEQIVDFTDFRKWVAAGAGHVDFYPGAKGKAIAIVRSIDFDTLDDHDFSDLHERCVDFMRSAACTQYLWPHLSDPQQAEMISTIIQEAELERERIRQHRQAGRPE